MFMRVQWILGRGRSGIRGRGSAEEELEGAEGDSEGGPEVGEIRGEL